MTPSLPIDPLLDAAAVAEITGLSRAEAYRLMRRMDHLELGRTGRSLRVRREVLDRYLNPEAPGWVYFLRHGKDGPIKIGFAVDVKRRLVLLQVGNPIPLRLLAKHPGSYELEAKIHAALSVWRIRGEWFSPSARVFEYMDQLLGRVRR